MCILFTCIIYFIVDYTGDNEEGNTAELQYHSGSLCSLCSICEVPALITYTQHIAYTPYTVKHKCNTLWVIVYLFLRMKYYTLQLYLSAGAAFVCH